MNTTLLKVKMLHSLVRICTKFTSTSIRLWKRRLGSFKMPYSTSAVENFQKYLRINTTHPDPDYEPAVKFLKDLAEDVGLQFSVLEIHPKKLICWMTWEGKNPGLSSILLNSHMDVVPVFADYWKYDPFSGHMDEDGNIFGRGSQDIKCIGIQYIEAIRKLKANGLTLNRTVHVSFVPDEEIGGKLGMALFVKHPSFKSLNVGFALDEASACPSDAFYVYYAERSTWWMRITCPGETGHGSQFIKNNAGEKMRRVINSFLSFREAEEKKFQADPAGAVAIGNYTSVNLTMLDGGVQRNVLPKQFSACFDVRVSPSMNLVEFEKTIQRWCREAGEDVTYEFLSRSDKLKGTSIDDSNPWWAAFSDAFKTLNLKIITRISQGGTDAAYLREVDIPVYGFAPMNNTPVLLHDHNEYLNKDVFLQGIEVYSQIIQNLATVPEFSSNTNVVYSVGQDNKQTN